jgi:hypothetical protein
LLGEFMVDLWRWTLRKVRDGRWRMRRHLGMSISDGTQEACVGEQTRPRQSPDRLRIGRSMKPARVYRYRTYGARSQRRLLGSTYAESTEGISENMSKLLLVHRYSNISSLLLLHSRTQPLELMLWWCRYVYDDAGTSRTEPSGP